MQSPRSPTPLNSSLCPSVKQDVTFSAHGNGLAGHMTLSEVLQDGLAGSIGSIDLCVDKNAEAFILAERSPLLPPFLELA